MHDGTFIGCLMGGTGTSSNHFAQVIGPMRPVSMNEGRFNKIVKIAKSGDICAIYGHLYEDVPAAQCSTYTFNTLLNEYVPRRARRRCKLCLHEQELQPSDWVDAK